MILQSLCEYYGRKNDLPQFGFEDRPIPFVVVIDKLGSYLNIEDTREKRDNKLLPRSFTVPSLPTVRKASLEDIKSGLTAGFAWDHFGYVFGQAKIDKKTKQSAPNDIELAKAQQDGFRARIALIHDELPEDDGISALILFFNNKSNLERIKQSELWDEIIKKDGAYIAFKLVAENHLICQSKLMIEHTRTNFTENKNGLCLVTGNEVEISRTHKALNIPGGTNPKLVSFNKESFESYGKSQSYNSPVGIRTSFEYTTALNHMLRSGSDTKFGIADTQFVCWADKPNRMESDVPLFLSFNDDDPEARSVAVKALFNSIRSGAYQESDGRDRFFVLGMAPNSARVVVRYWKAGTIAEIAESFANWFYDLELVGKDHYGYPTLKKILQSTALQFKDEKIAPNLPGSVVGAILSGGRLPDTLIHAYVRRIKAEPIPREKNKKATFEFYNYVRACVIKAYLNRKYRFSTTKKKELTVSLDINETRIGYCLGRLFAVLEKLQLDAQPGINATIRDRYYSSASTTPKAVFGTLMRMSTHHLKKLTKPDWRVNAEKRIGMVMALISDFPAHLNLENQSLFALGYYHQKQDLYTKKTDQGEDS